MHKLRRLERILLSVTIVLAGLAALYAMYWLIFLGSTFTVDRIVVSGTMKYTNAAEVARLSGVNGGERLFLSSVDAMHEKLRADPWVKAAAVRRRLPDTIWIRVEENVPAAIVAGGSLFYTDADGSVFKQLESADAKDFPVITGIEMDEYGRMDADNKDRLATMLSVIDQFGSSQLGTEYDVSEVNFSRERGYSVVTQRGGIRIVLGEKVDGETIAAIDRFSSAIKQRPGRIRYIIADGPKRVTVKYNET